MQQKNSSKPHYGGGDVPLKTGDAVLVDFGAESAGYCSDITRTYLTGKPGRELIELYSTVLEKMGYDPLPAYREPPESPYSTPDIHAKFPYILITGAIPA